MMEWQGMGLLILLLGLGGLGGLGMSLVFCARRPSVFDRLVLAVIWAPLFLSTAALILAEAGYFSRLTLFAAALAWGVLGAGGLLLHIRRTAAEGSGEEPGKTGVFLFWLALLLAGSGLLAVPAHRYLLGGWDPGEYVCTSANIARTGALAIRDPLLPSLSPAERTALMHEPEPRRRTLQAGYLVMDETTGALMPDYYHLYPAWLAIWVSLFGLAGAWAGHTAIAVAALALFGLAAARLFGRRTALLALLALAICPVQVYMMRFTTAEMLAQFLLFAGFWALERTLARPGGAGLALTAGAAFGAAILAHGTSILPAAGAGVFLFWRALVRRDREAWGIVASFGLFSLLALVWNFMRADTLTRFLWAFITGNPEHAVVGGAALGGAWLLGRYGRGRNPVFRWAPGVAVAVVLIYGCFIRPRQAADPDATNLVFLAQLIGPAGLALAGLFFWIRPVAGWTDARKAFLLAGLLTAAVLLANKMVQPVYLWAARRWAPLVIPFLVLLAAECVMAGLRVRPPGPRRALWKTAGWAGAILAAGLWFGGLAKAGAPVYATRDYEGLPAVLEAVAGAVKDADAVLCNHWKPATPLRYAYGIPAWQLSRQAEAGGMREARLGVGLLRRWAAEGKRVYWIGERFYDPKIRLEEVGAWNAVCRVLERREDRLPRGAVVERNRFVVYRVRPADAAAPRPEAAAVDVGYSAMGLAGFWELERDRAADGKPFAFRRTRESARVCLPAIAGPWRIRVAGATGRETSRVTLLADGTAVAAFETGPAWAIVPFSMPSEIGTNSVVWLEIRSTLKAGGGRGEGVGVDWIRSGE